MKREFKIVSIAAGIFFLLASFIYLLFAFGSADLNFLKWDGSTRALCAIVFAIALYVSIWVTVEKYT